MTRSERRWLAGLGAGLVAASVILYAFHFALFRDAHSIWFYLVMDIAFLPLEVLIVGVIIERVITLREKRALAHKLNMVIGTFFSEMGMRLLTDLLPALQAGPELRERLHLEASWKKEDFARAYRFAHTLECHIDLSKVDLEALKGYLSEERRFLLRLLENPNLMEHERFTDLLWAVVHVEQELQARPSLTGLGHSDAAHVALDIRRAYGHLLAEWILYTQHLKADYPYLFSLVCRTHPFQESPSPIVEDEAPAPITSSEPAPAARPAGA